MILLTRESEVMNMDEVQRLKEIIDARGIKGSFIDKALGKPRNWYSNIINRRKRLEIIDMTLDCPCVFI